MIKPGYKTSEFWFTLVSFIFSGLFLLGVIGDFDQKEQLITDVSHGVESCILIGGQLIILWKYINSRKEIKKTASIEIQKETNKSDDNSKRNAKTRTRNSNSTNKRVSKKPKKSSN